MKQHVVSGPDLPRWGSPISHAVVAGNTCYLSGQLAVDGEGRLVAGTPADEARLAFGNFFAALRAAGFAPADVVFVDIALTDLAAMPQINLVWCEFFPPSRPPARTVYQAVALPFGGQVKVTGVAVRDG